MQQKITHTHTHTTNFIFYIIYLRCIINTYVNTHTHTKQKKCKENKRRTHTHKHTQTKIILEPMYISTKSQIAVISHDENKIVTVNAVAKKQVRKRFFLTQINRERTYPTGDVQRKTMLNRRPSSTRKARSDLY